MATFKEVLPSRPAFCGRPQALSLTTPQLSAMMVSRGGLVVPFPAVSGSGGGAGAWALACRLVHDRWGGGEVKDSFLLETVSRREPAVRPRAMPQNLILDGVWLCPGGLVSFVSGGTPYQAGRAPPDVSYGVLETWSLYVVGRRVMDAHRQVTGQSPKPPGSGCAVVFGDPWEGGTSDIQDTPEAVAHGDFLAPGEAGLTTPAWSSKLRREIFDRAPPCAQDLYDLAYFRARSGCIIAREVLEVAGHSEDDPWMALGFGDSAPPWSWDDADGLGAALRMGEEGDFGLAWMENGVAPIVIVAVGFGWDPGVGRAAERRLVTLDVLAVGTSFGLRTRGPPGPEAVVPSLWALPELMTFFGEESRGISPA